MSCLRRELRVSEKDLHNANIGILVGTLIAVVGAVAFRHSDEATLQLVGLFSLLAPLSFIPCSTK